MSTALDGYGSNEAADSAIESWFPQLSALYPTLAEALVGNEYSRGDKPFRPPFTLMLCLKDGRLRSLLSSPESSRTWFGPSVDAQDVLGSVERALKGNQGEWSIKPEKNGRHRG